MDQREIEQNRSHPAPRFKRGVPIDFLSTVKVNDRDLVSEDMEGELRCIEENRKLLTSADTPDMR